MSYFGYVCRLVTLESSCFGARLFVWEMKRSSVWIGLNRIHSCKGCDRTSCCDLLTASYSNMTVVGCKQVSFLVTWLRCAFCSRDGISETEFLNTAREELTSVMAACKKLDGDYSPTISYVVVQKRHHTRFFVESPTDARQVDVSSHFWR